jgi:hypothetical protein
VCIELQAKEVKLAEGKAKQFGKVCSNNNNNNNNKKSEGEREREGVLMIFINDKCIVL